MSTPNRSIRDQLLDNVRSRLDWILRDQEYDEDGKVRDRWFENVETGEWTWADLRLTSKALEAKGVKIEDFFFI